MNYVACSRPPRYGLEKPPAPKAGTQRFLLAGSSGSGKIWHGVTPDHPNADGSRFKYSEEPKIMGIEMSRVIIENDKLILEFKDRDKLMKFVAFLKALGVTKNIEKKEIVIKYDEKFKEYMKKDRNLDDGTIRDYMNYLQKLNGKVINYDLYLEVSHNKWMIKCIRLYLDYLYKRGEISWEELQKLKSIFKVKKRKIVKDHKINEEKLITVLYDERLKPIELLIFKLLIYSGIRFKEVIKLINEFDESKLECFEHHCRYPLFWWRGRKRCDWVFLPRDLVEELRRYKGWYRGKNICSLTRYFEKKYGVWLKAFRKLLYRACKEITGKEVCDFIESRVSKLTIGDLHYDDLIARADNIYPKVIEKVNEVIREILMQMSIGVPEKGIEIVLDSGKVIKTDEIPPFDVEYDPNDPEEEERDVWEFNLEEELKSLNK